MSTDSVLSARIDRTRVSPNSGPRRPVGGTVGVRQIVIHYTGMRSAEDALARLCDPAAEVSAHYLIDESGRIHQLVDEHARAWHAGASYWRGSRDINSTSIGIELVNPGHEYGYRPFPDAQIAALIDLARDIVERHRLWADDVVGHSDIAPGRKRDPGELFPWRMLGDKGLGLWPTGPRDDAEEGLWPALSTIGYAVPGGDGGDILSPETGAADVIRAFQHRYRPARADGVADAETRGLIAAVAALVRANRTT